ncbi:MAG: hypothetical protein ACYDAR_18505 [Thermomicrobiales bacterium]
MTQRWRSNRGIRVAVLTVFCLLMAPALRAEAAGIYTSSSTGYDISFPQCDGAYPTLNPYLFGVVGVTSGHAFRNNPCFVSEYAWAVHTLSPEAVYLNLNEDIGTTAIYGGTGPYGVCLPDTVCHALNYGYNAASSAYTYAAQVPTFAATMWWLDIETANSWSETDLSLNRDVIMGALQYLQTERHFTVGIYSTASMWQEITGSWQNGLPAWVGGGTKSDARTRCGIGFTGGPVYLVQYARGDYDGNYAC